jgi:hypothetical protein
VCEKNVRKDLAVSNILCTFALEIKQHYFTTNQNKLKHYGKD